MHVDCRTECLLVAAVNPLLLRGLCISRRDKV